MKIMCYRCNVEVDPKEALQRSGTKRIQIRGDCPKCGRWIKWIPYRDSVLVHNLLMQVWEKDAKIKLKEVEDEHKSLSQNSSKKGRKEKATEHSADKGTVQD